METLRTTCLNTFDCINYKYSETMTLSYNGENEEWRYGKLSKVAQIMSIIDPELHDSISNLHYHEDCLTVTWMNESSVSEEGKSILQRIWELLDGRLIEHDIFQL